MAPVEEAGATASAVPQAPSPALPDKQAQQVQQLLIEVTAGLAPRQVKRVLLKLPEGSTVRDALFAADVWHWDETLNLNAIESGEWTVGVWGRKERPGHLLRDQDRVELVRQLKVDPKEARRVRYRAQGEKLPKGFHRAKPKA